MSKIGKISFGFVGVVVVLVIIAIILVFLNLNTTLKYAIEHYGPSVTGTPVNLDQVHVSLLSGNAELEGLKIGNPSGFDSGYAFKLNDIRVSLVPKSLANNTIVVNEIFVNGADLNAQFKGTKSNLQQILDNLKKSSGTTNQEQQPAGKAEPGTAKKFIVKDFHFTGGQVTVSSDIANLQQTIEIPGVEVHNIGNASDGVTVAQLTEQLLRPIIHTALEKAKTQVLQQGVEQIKQKAKEKLGGKLQELIQ